MQVDRVCYTGPLKKLFHYAIFQKFFHIFFNILMAYVLPYMSLNYHAILFLYIISTYNQTIFVYEY